MILKANPILSSLIFVFLTVCRSSIASDVENTIVNNENSNYKLANLEALIESQQQQLTNQTATKQPKVSYFLPLSKIYKFQSLISVSNLGRKQATKRVGIKKIKPSPVVLVPGFGGTRLEAKLSKKNAAHYFCDSTADWFDIWINVKMLLPYMIDCFIEDIRLEYDYATNTTKSHDGVEIRVKNDTSLYNIEYLHSLQISGFAYMAPIVNELLQLKAKNQGSEVMYKREVNLIGAPYDFRKAPNELQDYFEQLTAKIELLKQQSNQKVSLICHSMGCLNMLFLLQRKPQAWKDKHVRRLISIAAPWGGCTGALKATARGDNLGMPFLLSESKLNQIQRTLPSTIYLFPNAKVFGNSSLITANASFSYNSKSVSENNNDIQSSVKSLEFVAKPTFEDSTIPSFISSVFVSSSLQQQQPANNNLSPQRSQQPTHYTAQNLERFFLDINHKDGYYMWLNTNKLLNDLQAPGVEVHCLVGTGFRTLSKIEFMGQVPNSESVEHFEDGDGTVSIQSASYCKNWSREQSEPIVYKEFNVNHIESLKCAEVTNYIGDVMK